MKRIKKISAFLMMLMICFNVTIPVMAETITQDGLEVTLSTDKEEYSEGEQIILTFNVRNTNGDAVTDVSLENFVAEGYELPEEFDTFIRNIGTLEAGEEISFSVELTEDTNNGSQDNNNQNSNSPNNSDSNGGSQSTETNSNINVTSPKTGDNTIVPIMAACIAIVVGAGIIGAIRKKNGKNLLSVFLCIVLVASTFVGTSTSVSAAEQVRRVIVAEKTVRYAGEDVTFRAEISYLFMDNMNNEEDSEETIPPVIDNPEEDTDNGNQDNNNSDSNNGGNNDNNNGNTDSDNNDNSTDNTDGDNNDNNNNDNSDQVEDGYHLVWEDEFEGTELNRDDWNIELHEPGWVNSELQEYVDSSENIYVEDGNLVIKAIKSEDEGDITYTSGRINTQGKQDYKYGKFEAKIKVPSGQGLWPAFWMMPTDESFYGQWPKCGEIDIMEILGHQTTKSYGTIHFGDPHRERQGTYNLAEGDFSSDFHVFAVEWEPGEIRYYVDDQLFFTVNDWFTRREGYDEVAYPAPFDQPFYMILNLAVGGAMPGNPDETTIFDENTKLVVDYVRVYQKDSYDENVTKPEAVLRDPDATGNYVINGEFAVAEDLTEAADWQFLLAADGAGNAAITDGKMVIASTADGTENHSVQLVQANIPMEKGWKYQISFDAYADAERTIIADISAPDEGWIRYFPDTTVNLTTTPQTFTYTFDMMNETDANGRVEFNLGNQGYTDTVYIDNVRVEKVEQIAVSDEEKTILPDGNYVYNGEFQQGDNRLLYWEVENNGGAEYSVTNTNNVREFKVVVPSTVTNDEDVVLKQPGLALVGGKTYSLTFDAYADGDKTMKTQIAGQTFDSSLTTTRTSYKYTLETAADASDFDLKFLLGMPGTIYIDNVRIQEDGMLINGDFSNGLVGFEPFVDASANAAFSVDELTYGGACVASINDTGDADWKIQLKQVLTLEKDKWYKLSFDAKSTSDRAIMYAIQRDGTIHKNADGSENWTPYSDTKVIDLTSEYQNFSQVFQMTADTDEKAILSISMGAVNNIQITSAHEVIIDNIVLEEVETPESSGGNTGDDTATATEILKNTTFANSGENWTLYLYDGADATQEAAVEYTEGKATVTIANPGTADWHIKLLQNGVTLETGATYQVKFTVNSDATRFVSYGLQGEGNWYQGGDWKYVGAGVATEIDETFTVSATGSNQVEFGISMGYFDEATPTESTIEISNISIVKVSGGNDTVNASIDSYSEALEKIAVEKDTVSDGDAL